MNDAARVAGYPSYMTTPGRRPAKGGRARSGVRPVAAASGQRLAPMVYELLKQRLLEGTYQSGERLSVETLKTEFEVSKQPVMEALHRLAADSLVEIIPQVGCRVPSYQPQEVTDFYSIFGAMEGAVAGVAALRRTDDQLLDLQQVNDEIAELSANPDPAARSHEYRVLNREFHATVHTMAHSDVVADISQRMWDLSDLLINTSGAPRPLADVTGERHDDHDRIIAALRARDAATALLEMQGHIVGTVDIIDDASKAVS
jgi:DNA-binding GntR family transcriptional regulator